MNNIAQLTCVLQCDARWIRRVRYVLDVFGQALAVRIRLVEVIDAIAPVLVYSSNIAEWSGNVRTLAIRHDPEAWRDVEVRKATIESADTRGHASDSGLVLDFDVLAYAFFLLSAAGERQRTSSRQMYRGSVFEQNQIPQDAVDRCVDLFRHSLDRIGVLGHDESRLQQRSWAGHAYAIALTHDVDYLPVKRWDNFNVAVKSTARHLFKQKSPRDAVEAIGAYLWAVLRRQDPYGCVPAIIAKEMRLGVKSSFQVAVGHRHPFDVNYRVQDDRVRDYLAIIVEQDFDLCLHGSYRSTEQPGWYEEEVELLAQRLRRPLGSRQHFLSFDADALFAAQERTGIEYDMSVGFPDRCGSRAAFSHPYFPYCLEQERSYNVLQIPLVIMDVTLRSYMRLSGEEAWAEVERQIEIVRRAGGAVSVVWHPIVFGGARDPGFDRLYWRLVEYVQRTGGLATDGRTINALARERAVRYGVFPRPPAHYEAI